MAVNSYAPYLLLELQEPVRDRYRRVPTLRLLAEIDGVT